MPLKIETIRSSQTPWEIFQAVHAVSQTCFFLDSPRYAPPAQVYSYIGMDPVLEIRLDKRTVRVRGLENKDYPAGQLFRVLKKIFQWHRDRAAKSRPFFTGGFVGYLGYEVAALCDKIKFRSKLAPKTPQLFLGLFKDVIIFDHKNQLYYLASRSGNNEKIKKHFEQNIAKQKRRFKLIKFIPEMKKARFKTMVLKAKEYIVAGDIYQANLSQRFAFDYEGSPLELYSRLRAINPSPFSCFLKAGDLEIVSASPERLIRKKGRVCETRPIAGTCPTRGSKARFNEWRRKLLQNEKEKAEHLMLVDLERNDLGRVCHYRSVQVKEFMTLEKYSHVVHIVSKICGSLKKSKDAFDLIKAMFPGGTITGCPKIRCMEIIDELEPVHRGIYTGSLGYIDLYGDMDLNIVIRTMLLKKGKGHLQVGAGIVYDSNPEKEYRETLHKARALVQALRGASAS
jgi:para-aminobenzoate synthetase component 1